jgi:exosortase
MSFTKQTTLSTIALALFCIGFYPAITDLVNKWSNSDEYAHAFLTVPIIGYMVWRKRELLDKTGDWSAYLGLALLILAIPLYLVSLQLQVPTVTFVCMLAAIVGALVFLGGLTVIKDLATPLILLVLVIPIPNQIYSGITLPLQLRVSQASEWVVRLFSIPIFREGNVLHTPEKTFQIVEACSGMRSLITLVTLSLIMAYFTLDRNRSKLALLVSSMPVAFGVNIIRVVTLVLAYHFYRLDLTEGTSHTVLGMVVFGIALAALFGVQKVLERWEGHKDERRTSNIERPTSNGK